MPMKPFFNKTIISIICVVLLCFVVHVTTRNYYVVVHNEEMTSIKLEHQQSVSIAQTQHQNEIAVLNTRIQTVQNQLTSKTRELNHALRQKQDATIAGLNTGFIRLRDKHATDTCTTTSSNNKTDSDSATGQPDNGSSLGRELSRQTSEKLIRLATDAEQTNIALKACIQQYNNIKDRLNEQGSN